MDAFLKTVAEYLYQTYKSDIQNLCLVFPNRRAGVFFSRHLAQMIDKPLWMPQVRTIAELMKDLSGCQVADPLSLVFELYQVYKQEKKSDETFDEFYYWGEMLLNDFDDIDKYLVEPHQIFQNLADLREIEKEFTLPEEQIRIIREFWVNIKLHEASALKDDFISVWNILNNIYNRYRDELRGKGLAYEGMMCRDVCDKIRQTGDVETPFERFAIIGFNALNECEKQFFKHLQRNNKADFFWDYDDYYVDNTWHEAGHFIRDNRLMFPQPPIFTNHKSLTAPKNIEVISVPSDVGQAKMISNILERWNCREIELTGTAVVLCDEQLLVPVLSSLPGYVNDVNVTLGYPLRYTPVYSFFEALIAMHRNIRQSGDGVARFYHRDVTSLLNHPYIQMICGAEANELLDYIIRFNRIFLVNSELSKHDYFSKLFRVFPTSTGFIDYLVEIGSLTARLLGESQDKPADSDFHREYWFSFITTLNRLKDILDKNKILLERPTLIKVLRKMTSAITIPFKGEPLAGLQVMGVLETRNLDFTNVIMLSVNEGVLPKSEASMSFIPYNLRKGFGLPTIEHQDAVYAYYFYRMLQRAENVALLYNSQGGSRSGEMSRFLYQLKYEPAFEVKERGLNFQVSLSDEKEITINKTDEVMQSLARFTSENAKPRYFTPTALNAYLACSLRFYFRYVAQILEKEEVTEDIEGSMFGKLLHYAMEQLYLPFLNKTMELADFEALIADKDFIETCILKAFAVEFFKKENETPQLHGKSLVVREVLRKYIVQILEVDKKLSPLTPLEFEQTYKTAVAIDVSGKNMEVQLGGQIDRIDKTGDTFRVIDYKTGKVDRRFDDIPLLFEPGGKKQNKEALQILMYAYVLGEDNNHKHLSIVSGLYGMREIFDPKFDFRLRQGKEMVENFAQVKTPYLDGLKQLLAEIYDPTVPFTKTADKKACEYCDYKAICHR
ncbi:MAG: PD-(D/E)XK nuclease family protein [Bacteroidota bacterium]|nr:PD-(D/E)XK nuclease family protein [Bacteroidota bacterium]